MRNLILRSNPSARLRLFQTSRHLILERFDPKHCKHISLLFPLHALTQATQAFDRSSLFCSDVQSNPHHADLIPVMIGRHKLRRASSPAEPAKSHKNGAKPK